MNIRSKIIIFVVAGSFFAATPLAAAATYGSAVDSKSIELDSEGDGDLLIQPRVITACDANSTWYTVNSKTSSGKVTSWGVHVKNDATPESFTFTSSTTARVTASAKITGTASATAGLKKIAEATVGLQSEYALSGQIATTASTSRKVSFNTKGKWVIWSGVYTGEGAVTGYKCASNGQSSSKIGTVSGNAFRKARVTGLTNCSASVTDLVERSAKALCG